MKKVVYFIRTLSHRRSFETLVERDGIEQMILGPKSHVLNGVPQGYGDFGIKNVQIFDTLEDAQKILDTFKPDVLVQAEFDEQAKVPSTCKRVFVGHGMIGNHMTKLLKKGMNKTKPTFDYCCAQTKMFESFFNHITERKNNVLFNAMPQFDLLYNKDYYTEYRDIVLNNSKIQNPSRIILFCGFCCKNRPDYNLHNEDYFNTVIELAKISKRNNWLSIIKPRQHHDKAINFMKKSKKMTKYIKPFTDAINSSNLHCIEHISNTYRYFFADVIMCNACSTVETEACVVNKPLILIRTKSGPDYDPFDTVSSGAASLVKNINDLEKTINVVLADTSYVDKQNKLLKSKGIVMDGMAHKRVQDLICKIA
ncbi:hypothetical protein LCGC14_1755820 [marine sediment metagenome]|uniref:UDP-N-acetylglucosamine 2-epimerase domain-containing protein n=1 Tax=marine sediment metagenome TaxID=412755 RepID=A0A0F9H2L7_9ZZZZ